MTDDRVLVLTAAGRAFNPIRDLVADHNVGDHDFVG
jgi:hypothetical protein